MLHTPERPRVSLHPIDASCTNKLLAALPAEDYRRLLPQLTLTPLTIRQVLHREGQPIHEVYFPSGGACSLTKTMMNGATAEVAAIGSEGVIGAGVFLGDDLSASDTFVQVAGCSAYKMSTQDFLAEMERREALYHRILRYTQALLTQVMQSTVCNGLHSAEQRCCRWLLMTRDRVGTNEFKLTHDFLAVMLGVRRPTVTLILHHLQLAGTVNSARRAISIVDPAALEAASCECYEASKNNFHRLLPEIASVG